MKLRLDTRKLNPETHEDFLDKCESLVKAMGFYGKAVSIEDEQEQESLPDIDALLRLNALMGNTHGVVFTLELGASLDSRKNGYTVRDLIYALPYKDLQQVVTDYDGVKPKKSLTKSR